MADSASAAASASSPAAADNKMQVEDQKKDVEEKNKKPKAKPKKATDGDEEENKELKALGTATDLGTRVRKQTERLMYSKQAEPEIIIRKGKGKQLGDIENVWKRIQHAKKSDRILKSIHLLCFGSSGSHESVKKNLKLFSGVADDDELKTVESRLKTKDLATLKDICDILDVVKSGTKPEVTENLLAFFKKPEDSGRPYQKAVKKKKSKSKGKGAKKGSTGRAPSAYIIFCNEKRASIKAKHPDLSMIETTKKLAEKWNKLSDAEKAEYQKKAGSAGSKRKAPDSGSDDEDDEEDEDEEDEKDDSSPPPAKKQKTSDAADVDEATIEKRVREILKGADLANVRMRDVKDKLKTEFGDVISQKKDWLQKLVVEIINA